MTYDELGKQIKSKYPQYGNVPDAELGQKIVEKYPQYKSQITEPQGESLLSKAVNFVSPALKNIATDVGASIQVDASGPAQQSAQQHQQQLQALAVKAGKETDPVKKAKLLDIVKQGNQSLQPQSPEFSPDVNVPAWQRGLATGVEVGTVAAPLPVAGGTSALSKIGSAALQGAGIAGARQAVSTEDMSLQDRAVKTGEAALVGGLAGGAIQGAGELGNWLKDSVSKAGGKVKDLGTSLVQSQYNVPRSAANSYNLKQTVSDLADYGVTDVNKIPEVAKQVSDAVEPVIRDAVSKAKPVNTDGLYAMGKELVSDPSIPTGQDKKLLNFFKKTIDKLSDRSSASASQTGNPLNVLDQVRNLEKQAASISRGRPDYMVQEADKAVQRAYRSFADELKDRLYSGAGADSQVLSSSTSKGLLDKLSKISPKLADKASQATSVKELRSLMAPFVRGSKLSEITATGENLAIQNVNNAVKGVGKLVQNPMNLLAVPLGSDTVNRGVGQALRGAGDKLSKGMGGRFDSLTRALGQTAKKFAYTGASKLP